MTRQPESSRLNDYSHRKASTSKFRRMFLRGPPTATRAGPRRLRDELQDRGHTVNRKRIQRLRRQMGLRARYPRQRTSQSGKGHKIYLYLRRDLSIEHANQVWATDIRDIPIAKGFMYLVDIKDSPHNGDGQDR